MPPLSRAECLIDLAALLVPARLRDDWRREWLGELASVSDPNAPMVRHALGAFSDAFWIRQREVADLDIIDDLRHGWRQLRQQSGFAVTAVAILALSMAASVTAFSVVSQVLLRPLPYPDPERIVTIWERHAAAAGRQDVAPGNFLDWRARSQSFSALAGAEPYSYDYTGGERPEVLPAANVTEGFFDIFGVRPLAGRYFLPAEHARGNNQVVVLSARFWRSHFAADPAIVGRAISIDAKPYVVVGVAPDDFQPYLLEDFVGETRLWAAKAIEDFEPRIRTGGYWQVAGRLKDGATLASAQAEMNAIATQLTAENPRTNKDAGAEVITLRDHLVGDVRPAVNLFTAAVFAVLLIACVNVTNLLLARGATRQQELAVRTALGAHRGRLVGQLLAETLLLAAVSSAFAVLLAQGAMRLLARLGPREVLWIETLHVDRDALLFAAALAAAVTVAAGLVPALRLSAFGLQAPGHRTMTGDRGQRRLRSTLVAVEVALALMLVSGTGLLLKSFVNLVQVDTGFQQDGVLVVQMFSWDRNPTPAARRLYFEQVTTRAAALPGIERVGLVGAMPFIESNIDIRGVVQFLDRPAPAPGEEPRVSLNVASPGYFDVMRIPLVRGRHLGAADGPDAPRVAVISAAMAGRHFRDLNPIGQRMAFRYSGQVMQVEIVGVVGATRHERLDEAPRVELFLPHAQAPSGSMTLVARAFVDPAPLIESIKTEIWAIDPLQTFYRTATLDELVERTLTTRRFALIVLTGFAALALLLAAAGLYGVLSTIVSQYRREIGVRMALGARWTDILRLVVVRGLGVAAVGVAAGLLGVFGGARVLSGYLFSVAPTDPLTIGGAALLMLAVAAVACYVPARRAANADPCEALRLD